MYSPILVSPQQLSRTTTNAQGQTIVEHAAPHASWSERSPMVNTHNTTDFLPQAAQGNPAVSENDSPYNRSEATHPANERPARTTRKRLRCSICKHSFSRLEHLTRHERSHRNERPFSCSYCDARFTRKDLIKTHNKRHHKDIIESRHQTVSTNPGEAIPVSFPAEADIVSESNSSRRNDTQGEYGGVNRGPSDLPNWNPSFPSSNRPPASDVVIQEDMYDDWTLTSLMEPHHAGIDFDGFLAEMESSHLPSCPPGNTPDRLSLQHLGQLQLQNDISTCRPAFTPAPVEPSTESPSSIPPIVPPVKHTSLEISKSKLAEISQELMKMAPETKIQFPSRLALEGYLTTFFALLLPNIPFLHTPTWQADQSHPSLVLAMAALGAALCGKDEIGLALHHGARLSVLNHIESYNFGSRDQPIWVIQSLLLSMSFGTWSGNLGLAQQALASQSILAQLVGYVKNPDDSWATHKDDANLCWEEWITTETIIRTKLVVYIYFGNLNIACNIPPALLNSEVNISLPSSEGEWLATTAQMWSQMRKRSERCSVSFSDALESLMLKSEDQAVRCSALGSLVMLHAILQQIWHIRQHNPTRNSPKQILSLERALGKWKAVWETDPESSLSAANPHYGLSLSSYVLLASAYTRVYTVIGRIRLSTLIHDADMVAGILSTSVKEIPRSPGSVNAALHAILTLLLPIKLGRVWTDFTVSGACSLHPFSFCSMQLCQRLVNLCASTGANQTAGIFVSKWLELLELEPRSSWTQQESENVELVESLVEEFGASSVDPSKKLHARLLYAWADLFKHSGKWGIIPILIDAMVQCGNISS